MQILLTENEVTEALETYISKQINLTTNQEVTVEVGPDGSAAVSIRTIKQGAQAAKAADKSKAKRGRPPKNAVRQEAVEKEEAKVDQEAQYQANDQQEALETESESKDVSQEETSDDQTEAPDEPAKEPAKSIFGSVSKAGVDDDESPDNSSDEGEAEAPKESVTAPCRSIFSKVV